MDSFLRESLVAAGVIDCKVAVSKLSGAHYRYRVTCSCGFRSTVDGRRRDADAVAETHKRNMRILAQRGGSTPDDAA